jgi:hypothetical protein
MADTNDKNGASPVADRRGFLKALTGASAVAATAVVAASEPAEAQSTGRESRADRVKARYQANSADVQNFYRTNRY